MVLWDELEEFSREIDAVSTSIPKLKNVLEKLRELRDEVQDHINDLEAQSDFLEETAQGIAFAETARVARDWLHGHARDAIISTKEYDFPGLGERLLDVIRSNDKVITIEARKSTARIRVHLNETAGTLEEYAKAVQAAREELGVGYTKGDTASKMWAEKVYKVDREGGRVGKRHPQKTGRGRGSRAVVSDLTDRYKGKYHRTIQARVQNFRKPAPWWSLLNHGNHTGRFGSGGEPYPVIPPTKFVSRTVVELTNYYRDNYKRELEVLKENNKSDTNNAYDDLKIIDKLIERVEELLRELEDDNYKRAIALIEEQLDKYGEYRKKRADPEKLKKLALDLARGVQVGRRRLGNDVRVRTERIQREIKQELRKNRNVS